MIIVEREDDFYLVEQHEHARASGWMARQISLPLLSFDPRKEDVYLAIDEHDRGWLDLDHTPMWNDVSHAPFSFVDYPLYPKLHFYTKGIDEVESKSLYAALLCSLHYASFFDGEQDQKVCVFLQQERERQRRLLHLLELWNEEDQEALDAYFHLLQFCDHLSLYLCLTDYDGKQDPFSWNIRGFSQRFEYLDYEQMMPVWEAEDKVSLTPFPFESSFVVQIPGKVVRKEDCARVGLAEAYRSAQVNDRVIQFVERGKM